MWNKFILFDYNPPACRNKEFQEKELLQLRAEDFHDAWMEFKNK